MTLIGVKMFITLSLFELNLFYRILHTVKDCIKVFTSKRTLMLLLPELIHDFVRACEVMRSELLKTAGIGLILLLLLGLFDIKDLSFLTTEFYEVNPLLWQNFLSLWPL